MDYMELINASNDESNRDLGCPYESRYLKFDCDKESSAVVLKNIIDSNDSLSGSLSITLPGQARESLFRINDKLSQKSFLYQSIEKEDRLVLILKYFPHITSYVDMLSIDSDIRKREYKNIACSLEWCKELLNMNSSILFNKCTETIKSDLMEFGYVASTFNQKLSNLKRLYTTYTTYQNKDFVFKDENIYERDIKKRMSLWPMNPNAITTEFLSAFCHDKKSEETNFGQTVPGGNLMQPNVYVVGVPCSTEFYSIVCILPVDPLSKFIPGELPEEFSICFRNVVENVMGYKIIENISEKKINDLERFRTKLHYNIYSTESDCRSYVSKCVSDLVDNVSNENMYLDCIKSKIRITGNCDDKLSLQSLLLKVNASANVKSQILKGLSVPRTIIDGELYLLGVTQKFEDLSKSSLWNIDTRLLGEANKTAVQSFDSPYYTPSTFPNYHDDLQVAKVDLDFVSRFPGPSPANADAIPESTVPEPDPVV
jgi:hypothetical protein